ncbi:hypothetical protein J2X04_000096 [Lysobacter niabensis]|uniref:Tetratricopeptide repeat protein n=1 Tax=Agrilutibacter niabensis TaxID=380628 RepID=A0ABU1VJV1_9GAMM|nr:hypothetical protein [Lysobacter niabensis]MDR7097749.1 hypothetical protein [Lysobacter niabensis]
MQKSQAWLLLAMAITVAVYWVGLSGPLVLDDHYNLEVLQRWLMGKATLHAILFDGRSGMFGRPLAMASLALSAWLGGYTPFAFKLGNLIVHLLCGGAVFLFVRRIARLDVRLREPAGAIAATVATLWMMHPLQASTVLYSVQRMAMLSTLCTLLGLWLFVAMRERLQRGKDRAALIGLFAGVPMLTAAGFLAKENAVLLPALCLVVELGYFHDTLRPRAVKSFFGIYVLAPLLLGLAWFATNPSRLLAGYLRRDFDWQERLLTQARALCDYLSKIVLPNPPRMGVYTDDFALSTGLLAPPTTLIAICVLASISVAAWRLRRRLPSLFVGWGIFLVGHAIESSIIPLELYYEHRNYLPLLGVLYALVGLTVALGRRLQSEDFRPGRIGITLGAAVLVLFALGTHGRARVWSTPESLALSAVAAHPQSVRANMALVDAALRHGNGEMAAQSLQRLVDADNPRTRALGHLNRLYITCALDRNGDPNDLKQGTTLMPTHLTYAEPELFGLLLDKTGDGCGAVDANMLGEALAGMVNRARAQPDSDWAKWQLRYVAARFFALAKNWPRAREQALLAWQPGSEPAIASLLVQTQLATGDLAGANKTYYEAKRRIDPANAQDMAGMKYLHSQIEAAISQGSQTYTK